MAIGKAANFTIIRDFVLSSSSPLELAAKMAHRYRELSTSEKDRSADMVETGEFCEEMAAKLMAIASASKDPGKW